MTKNKLSKKQKVVSLIISFVIILATIIAVYWLLSKPAKAAWWNDSWLYRQKTTINNSGSAQTDFQISITLDTATLITAGKMQSDCDDIRLTDANGKLLPHWIEEANPGCNSSTTKIWTKLASIPTTSQVLYIYYGNAAATNIENGDGIFMFFDNFNNDYTREWSEFNTGTASISVSGGKLNLSTSSPTSTASVYTTNPVTPGSTNFIVEEKLNLTGSTGTNIRDRSYLCQSTIIATGCTSPAGFDFGAFSQATGPQPQAYWNAFTGTSITTANEIKMTHTFDGTNFTWALTDLSNNSSIYSNSASQASTAFNYVFLGATHDGGATGTSQMAVDWVISRKYAATPPSVAAPSGEEQSSGPVAYWKFDEGTDNTCSGGTNDACNSTGSSINDGAKTGALWQSEDMCVSGKCLWFDGTDDVVSVTDNDSVSLTTNLTLEAWIKMQSTGISEREIISKYLSTGNQRGFGLYLTSADKVSFIADDDGTGSNQDSVTSNTVLSQNVWYHVVATFTPSTSMSIYVNGKLDNTAVTDIATINDSNQNFKIGEANSSFSGVFKGMVDEVEAFNYTRSASQIKSDYSAFGASKGVSAVLGANDDNNSALSSGLAAYWKMNETSGNAADSSGNANTLTNTGTTTFIGGKFGNAPDINGTTQYFTSADNASLSTGDIDFTVAGWFNLDVVNADQTLISKENAFGGGTTAEYRLDFTDSGDTIRWTVYDSGHNSIGQVASTAISASTWYYIVAWHDSVNNKVGLQVNNGNLFTADTTGSPSDTAATFFIGARGGPNDLMNGRADEVRFYKRVLTQAERNYLYNWAPGPVGYWKMDENIGSSAFDTSGNENTGTLTNGPLWDAGKYGSAVKFDASDDYINIPNVAGNALDFGTSQDFTVSGWFKTNAIGSAQALVAKKTSNGLATVGYLIILSAGGKLNAYVSSNGSTQFFRPGATTLNANTWYHFAFVFDDDSATNSTFWLNGVLDSGTATGTISDVGNISNTQPVTIGQESDHDNTVTFNGIIDDIRIYNYARTPKQIMEDLNGGHPAGGSPVASQANYWTLDEQQGQTANDKGTADNDLTLGATSAASSDDPTWETAGESACKINGCQTFDGSSDLDQIGSSVLTATNDYSVSAWINPTDITSVNIFGEGNTGNTVQAMRFGIDASSKLLFQLINDSDVSIAITSANTISASTWTHVAVTKNGSDFRLYINGKLNGQATLSTSGSYTFNSTSVGALKRSTTIEYFAGQIDEVKVYNGPLTADEIKVDYNAGSAISLGGVLGAQDNEGFGNLTPAAYWKMDENNDSSTTADSSGNSKTMTMNSMGTLSWIPGKYGGALSFDGSTKYLSNATSILSISNFTITAWIKPNATSGCYNIYSQGTTGALFPYFQFSHCSGGLITFASRNDANTQQDGTSSSNAVIANQWNFVAMTKSGATVNYYVNGIKTADTVATAGTYNNMTISTVGMLRRSANSAFFDGAIDDVRVFNSTLTDRQIAYISQRGAPVGLYKFDECQGTTAYNAAPTESGLAAGNNGTITPGAGSNTSAGVCSSGTSSEMWNDGTTGKINSSLGFDGTDDYVSMGSVSAFNTSALSWSAWVKTTNDAAMTLFANTDPTGNNDFLQLCLGDGCTSVVSSELITIAHNAAGVRASYVTSNRNELFDGNWHHITMTADGSAYHLYLDGRDLQMTIGQGSNDGTTSVSSYAMTTIGMTDRSANTSFMNGLVDDARIYNYALTQTQVKTIMNNGAIFFGPATGSP